MINLGIVEDQEGERNLIKIAINNNFKRSKINFIDYKIGGNEEYDLESIVVKKIEDDIRSNRIQGLIIDQSMCSAMGSVKGSDIYKYFIERIREFPIIILTNYSEAAALEKEVDSDKIYRKKEFLPAEDDKSKKCVEAFMRNVERFMEKRLQLQRDVKKLQDSYVGSSTDEGFAKKIIFLEDELRKYELVDDNLIEKNLLNIDFEKVLNIIEKVDDILDEK